MNTTFFPLKARQLRHLAFGLLIVSLLACTTMQTFDRPFPHVIRESLAVGDRVRILTTDDARFDLTIEALSDTGIAGKDVSGGQSRTVPFDQITSVERRKVSGTRTAWFVGGMVTIVGVIVAVIVHAGHNYGANLGDLVNGSSPPDQ